MQLTIKSKKTTPREGNHPDDDAYLEGLRGQLELRLAELGFVRPEIELKWAP